MSTRRLSFVAALLGVGCAFPSFEVREQSGGAGGASRGGSTAGGAGGKLGAGGAPSGGATGAPGSKSGGASSSQGGASSSQGGASASGGKSGGSSSGGKSNGGATSGGAPGGGVPGGGAPGGGTTSNGGSHGGAPTAGAPGNCGGASSTARGPFTCGSTPATCNQISSFPLDGAWGSGDFTGGLVVYGKGLSRDMTQTEVLHITGTVDDYVGFAFWFSTCSSLDTFKGVQFKLSNMLGAGKTVRFQLQTNADFPWQSDPNAGKGACTATTCDGVWGECTPPEKRFTLGSGGAVQDVQVYWADMSGGTPVAWNANSPTEIVGLQWQFAWEPATPKYDVDVTLDDITFIGATTVKPCVK